MYAGHASGNSEPTPRAGFAALHRVDHQATDLVANTDAHAEYPGGRQRFDTRLVPETGDASERVEHVTTVVVTNRFDDCMQLGKFQLD